MVHKKKYRFGFVILLGLLFTLLFSTFSECYAFSNEYIKFTLDSIYEDTSNNLSSSELTFLNNYKNNTSNVSSVVSLLNTYSSLYNLPTNDRNLICFIYKPNASTNFQIVYIVSNCTFASSSVGFLDLRNNSTNILRPYSLNGSCLGVRYTFTGSSFNVSQDTNIYNYYITSTGYSYFNNSDSVITLKNCYNYMPTQSIYYSPLSKYVLINNNNFTYTNTLIPDEPDDPVPGISTGDITNNSGEKTGSIDLSGIENGITNIQNQISGDTQKVINNQNQNTQTIVNAISGETQKITNTLTDSADDLIDNTVITSGDIESALNFEIAQDPYSNFWFTLTNNLKSALLGTKRSIDISFQGRTWTISLDEYMVLPAWLIIILTPFSTAFFTWVLVRQFKLIFDKLSSGNVDALLKENSEERHL